METETRICLAILMAYRLARLITQEDGPGDFLYKLRKAAGVYEDSPPSLGKLMDCSYCVGVWLAIILSALVVFPTSPGDGVLIIFGIAGGQAWLQSKAD